MKIITATLTFCLFALIIYGRSTYKGLPLIKADSIQADYRIGNDWVRGNWTISLQIEFDSLFLYYYSKYEEFAFYTDRDSIAYKILPENVYKFYVSVNDTAYALTVVKGVKPKHIQLFERLTDS